MNLVHFPDPILNQVAKTVQFSEVSPEWLDLFCDRMLQVMVSSGGVGLAAPQVGHSIRVFVMLDEGDRPLIAINPTLVPVGTEMEQDNEGCLSFPGEIRERFRHKTVLLQAYDSKGERWLKTLKGFSARVAQHEFDHLQGVHFGTGLSWLKRKELAKALRR